MTTHIEDFARELRGLKERSGRSYGVLATRLHVSTSTLHRYCNGAAVPGDYAPVERFARQCGATREELVGLHRLWLLADAARRREPHRGAARGSGGAGTPGAAVDARASGGEGSSADVGADGGPGGADGAGTTDTPGGAGPGGSAAPGASAPETAAPETSAQETAASAKDVPRVDVRQGDVPPTGVPETRAPAAEAPQGEIPAVSLAPTPEADGERPARRPRRTKVVLGAVAVIAAVLPLVLHNTGREADDTRASAPGPRVTAGAGATAPTSASAPPPASASTSAAAAATASAPASVSPRTTPPRTPVDTRPPVQVTVLSNNWDIQCGQWFLLTRPPGKVPPPPSLQETNAWAAALGGVPAGDLRLQLTAQGVPGRPVVLHALYVRVVSSGPAPKGRGYTPASGCGGGIEPASFDVDLDPAVPRARPLPGSGEDRPATVTDFPFQVSAADPQVLDVDAHTADHDVSWYLELVWSCGDRQGTLKVDDNGRPFRTVGLKGAPTYFYDGENWAPAIS